MCRRVGRLQSGNFESEIREHRLALTEEVLIGWLTLWERFAGH